MATTTEFNPLLKKGFQDINDTSAIETEISNLQRDLTAAQELITTLQNRLNTLQGNKITKCVSAADLATLTDAEIFEWQGSDTADFKTGFFYKVSKADIPAGSSYFEYLAGQPTIAANGYIFSPGNYYVVNEPNIEGTDVSEYYLYKYNNTQYYSVSKSGQLSVGDKVWDDTNKQTLTVTQKQQFNITLSNGVTFDSSGKQGSQLENIYDCKNAAGENFSFILCVAQYIVVHYTLINNVFTIQDFFLIWYFVTRETSSPINIAVYTQTDTQPRLANITNGTGGVLNISTDTNIAGNLTVSGTSTTVHAQEIQSEADYIELRNGNPLALANNERSGIEVNNYDGNGTDCILAVDNQGWARVGDKNGTLQRLATIQDTPTNNYLLKYNTTSKQLESVDYFLAVSRITCPLDITDTPENFAKWVLDYFYNENIIRHVIINTIVTWGSDYWVQGATYAYSDKYCYFTFQQTAGSLNKFFARYQNNVFKFNE